jgi:hypothetical protein
MGYRNLHSIETKVIPVTIVVPPTKKRKAVKEPVPIKEEEESEF